MPGISPSSVVHGLNLGRNANDTFATVSIRLSLQKVGAGIRTASRSGTGVASLERLLVATLAEIVGTSVDDDSAL